MVRLLLLVVIFYSGLLQAAQSSNEGDLIQETYENGFDESVHKEIPLKDFSNDTNPFICNKGKGDEKEEGKEPFCECKNETQTCTINGKYFPANFSEMIVTGYQNLTIGQNATIDTGGFSLSISNTSLGCAFQQNDTNCRLYINVTKKNQSDEVQPFIELKNSSLNFQLIYMESNANITSDRDSNITATGTGPDNLDHNKATITTGCYGGSFGGQGGSDLDNLQKIDSTYGSYWQTPESALKDNKIEDITGASGIYCTGNTPNYCVQRRGGGAIILLSDQFVLYGPVDASGDKSIETPDVGKDENFAGGSGGFIYINQTNKTGFMENFNNTFPNPPPKVNGGSAGGADGCGGSGGRIVIDVRDEYNIDPVPQAFGGSHEDGKQVADKAVIGAPGTVYFNKTKSLILRGLDNSQPNGKWQTPVKFDHPQSHLKPDITIDTFAILAPVVILTSNSEPEALILGNKINVGQDGSIRGPLSNKADSGSTYKNITVKINCFALKLFYNGEVKSSQSVDKAFNIKCNKLEMVDQAIIDVQALNNVSFNINETMLMSQDTKILAGGHYEILGGDLTIFTIISSGASWDYTNASITTQSGNIYLLEGGELATDFIGLVSTQNITIGGKIHPSPRTDPNQPIFTTCYGQELVKQPVQPFVHDQDAIDYDYIDPQGLLLNQDKLLYNVGNWTRPVRKIHPQLQEVPDCLYKNFTTSLVALQSLTIEAGAEVQGPRIGIYSDQMIHQGLLNTTSWGCQAGDGKGFGEKAKSTDIGATGGSYAGQGGLPTPTDGALEQLRNRPFKAYGQYDSMSVMEGSGGGQGLQLADSGGRGGGYVWIQASDLFLDQGSWIRSDGGNAQEASRLGGGGSGGTISISTFWLSGNGEISVQGGSAAEGNDTAGGAGSGGRFKLLRYAWGDSQTYNASNSYYSIQNSENNVIVHTDGGISVMNDSHPASVWSTPCPAGYAGATCSPCPVGYFSDDVFNRQCQECTNLPLGAHGSYNQSGWGTSVCPYICNGALPTSDSNPMCLSTSSLFLQNLGGPIIFAIIIVSTLVLIFAVSFYLSENSKSKSMDKLDRAMGSQIDKKDENSNNLKYLEQTLKFFDRDVYQHFCRIYLVGNNRAMHPWKLPLNPPASLRPRILLERYVQFANEINQEFTWGKLEIVGLRALAILYPAALPRYIYWRRRKNCFRFINMLSQKMDSERSFWKNDEDRMRYHTQFKFSFSKNVSLGCIDFLDQRLTADSFEGPQFPLTLFLGGEGLYHDPYNVDYENDPVIKSVGLKLEDHKIWKKFVQNLNSKLSSLQPLAFNFYLVSQFHDILGYINSSNQNIFKYHNFKVSLWMIEHFYPAPKNSNGAGEDFDRNNEKVKEAYYRLDLHYIKKKSTAFVNFLNYWRSESIFNDARKEFRLCLVLQEIEKARESAVASGTGNQSTTVRQRKLSFDAMTMKRDGIMMDSQHESSVQPRNDARSNQSSSPEVNNRHQSPYGFKLKNSTIRTTTDPRNEVVDSLQFIMSNIREPHIDRYWLKQFKNKDIKLSCMGRTKKFFQNIVLIAAAIVQMSTLRIQVNNSNIIAAMIPYIFFVLFDGLFTFTIMGQITRGQDPIFGSVGGALFVLFYPLASIISPLLGALSMISCKTRMFQNQAYLNALSLYTNTLGLLIASIFTEKKNSYLITMSALLLATKFGLAQLLPLHISYFNNPKYSKNIEFLNQVKTLNIGRDPNRQGDNDSNNSDSFLSDQGSNSDMHSPNKQKRPSLENNQRYFYDGSPEARQTFQRNRQDSFPSAAQESNHNLLTDDQFDGRVSSMESQGKKGGFSFTDRISKKFLKRGNSNNKLQKRRPSAQLIEENQQPINYRRFEYDVEDYADAGSPYKIEDLQPPIAMYGGIGARDPRNDWNRDIDNSLGSNAPGFRSRESDLFNI